MKAMHFSVFGRLVGRQHQRAELADDVELAVEQQGGDVGVGDLEAVGLGLDRDADVLEPALLHRDDVEGVVGVGPHAELDVGRRGCRCRARAAGAHNCRPARRPHAPASTAPAGPARAPAPPPVLPATTRPSATISFSASLLSRPREARPGPGFSRPLAAERPEHHALDALLWQEPCQSAIIREGLGPKALLRRSDYAFCMQCGHKAMRLHEK